MPTLPVLFDLSRLFDMPDETPASKPTPLMCEVPTCRSTTDAAIPEMEAKGWRHDDEHGWQCPDHRPAGGLAELIDELQKLPAYTVRADRLEVYADATGQWFMFGDLKRIIDKYRAPQ